MSLYSDISQGLSSKGINNTVGSVSDSLTQGLGSAIKQVGGGGMFGDALSSIGTSMARNAATGVVNKFIPPGMQRIANSGAGAIGDIMRGDFDRAALRIFDSGLLHDLLPGMDGVAAQARYFGTPTPLFGGLTPSDAIQIYNESASVNFARKNLFLIEVSSNLMGDVSSRFNLFATDVEYTPFTITGEKKKVGASSVDCVNSAEPIELRITTMDDEDGFIKSWFKAHCEAVVSKDGTIEPPGAYAIKIKIVYGYISDNYPSNAYYDIGYFRPANTDSSLSRKDDALEEIQLSFSQLDTFY